MFQIIKCKNALSRVNESFAILHPQVGAGPSLVAGSWSGQGAVELFDQAVTLRMKWCRPGLLNAQLPADLPRHLGLKVPALVAVQLLWHTKPSEHLSHQAFSSGNGALVRDSIGFRPFGEVVHGHKNIAVTLFCDWKWPQNVQSHTLHGGPHLVLLQGGIVLAPSGSCRCHNGEHKALHLDGTQTSRTGIKDAGGSW